MARVDQILASSRFLGQLPKQCQTFAIPIPASSGIREGKELIELVQLDWQRHESYQRVQAQNHSIDPNNAHKTSERLCIRYRGKTFLLDDKTPTLTMGRDPSSKLLIEDRKASRAHGRIEKRNGIYFYVDSSTNGSFVSFPGQMEVMVRKDEIQLRGPGRICFGTSRNDSLADFADFEYL